MPDQKQQRRFCGTLGRKCFLLAGMITLQPLPEAREILLRTLQIERLDTSEQRHGAQALLQEHHYLEGIQAVGEQMHYAVADAQGEWVAVLIFAAAALHLRPRDPGSGGAMSSGGGASRSWRTTCVFSSCPIARCPISAPPR
jgi:hypothetical protein